MFFRHVPTNFHSNMDVAICICEDDKGKVLILRRAHDKTCQPSKWGFPAGKQHDDENMQRTARRELAEETGIETHYGDLHWFDTVYFRYPHHDITAHLYYIRLPSRPTIKLNSEHSEYDWVSPLQALHLDLMLDEEVTVKLFCNHYYHSSYDIPEGARI